MKYNYRISYDFTTLTSEGVGCTGVTRNSQITSFDDLKEIENSLKKHYGYTFCIITKYELLSVR